MAAAGDHSPERGHAHAPAMDRHSRRPLLESPPTAAGWQAGPTLPMRSPQHSIRRWPPTTVSER